MIASNLVSQSVIPLKTSDIGRDALRLMSELHVRHLPIVNNEQLLGLISEENILSQDKEEAIGSYNLTLSHPYVKFNDHLYEMMRLMSEYGLTLIPVVNASNDYIGSVTMEDLLKKLSQTASFAEPGGVIVLEMNKNHYSLVEIAKLVEAENITILSSFVTSFPESVLLEVTLKLNTQKLNHIKATLDRFGYNIKASFIEHHYEEVLQDRYDSLISYLNV